jgi:hypothetical protein
MATPAKDKTLTSLKLEPQEFDDFKVMCVRTKFSLSKLVDRAMHYYINNWLSAVEQINLENTIHNIIAADKEDDEDDDDEDGPASK